MAATIKNSIKIPPFSAGCPDANLLHNAAISAECAIRGDADSAVYFAAIAATESEAARVYAENSDISSSNHHYNSVIASAQRAAAEVERKLGVSFE